MKVDPYKGRSLLFFFFFKNTFTCGTGFESESMLKKLILVTFYHSSCSYACFKPLFSLVIHTISFKILVTSKYKGQISCDNESMLLVFDNE